MQLDELKKKIQKAKGEGLRDYVKDIASIENIRDREEMANIAVDRAEKLDREQKPKGKEASFIRRAIKNEIARTDEERARAVSVAPRAEAKTLLELNGTNEYMFLGNWQIDGSGRILQYNPRMAEQIACYDFVFPVKIFKNVETGTEKVVLLTKVRGVFQDIIVDRAVISNATQIAKVLSNKGVGVTSENAKFLVTYIAEMLAFNREKIQVSNSTSKFGWMGHDFIPYDKKVEFDNKEGNKDLFEAIGTKGTRDKWFSLVSKVRQSGRSEPMLMLAASFASPLLEKLGLLPFIVNLCAGTGSGKTVALLLAGSIYGNPAENALMTSANSTSTSLEVKSDILNNLPLLIDDFSAVNDKGKEDMTKTIYDLCDGKSKSRSNTSLTLNRVRTWRNVVITNLERPLVQEEMKGGAINRVIDFMSEDGQFFDDPREVAETLRNNFGWIGPEWIAFIKSLPEGMLSDKHKEWEEKIREKAGNSADKQIKALAVLLLADELAELAIFHDGKHIDFNYAVSQLKDMNAINESLRAFSAIISEVQMNINNFKKSAIQPWGKFDNDEAPTKVYVIPSVLKRWAKEHNFNDLQFRKWAFSKGILKGKDGKAIATDFSLNGVDGKAFLFNLTMDNDEFVNADESFQEELPFD